MIREGTLKLSSEKREGASIQPSNYIELLFFLPTNSNTNWIVINLKKDNDDNYNYNNTNTKLKIFIQLKIIWQPFNSTLKPKLHSFKI